MLFVYFLRYVSPRHAAAPFRADQLSYWLPVDLYTGGAEHAVMHLFYARFFIKALRDLGLVSFGEPFQCLFNQGVIIVERQKMSKSRGNVITPDEYVVELGADAVRAYLMFVAPWEQGGEWDDSGLSGISRWLNRVWNLVQEKYKWERFSKGQVPAERELYRVTHKTIKKVTSDLGRMRFNTVISALMEFTNYLAKVKEAGSISLAAWEEAIRALLLLLAPTTPHLTEELWQRLGYDYSIHNQRWPEWNEALAKDEQITLVVQVNGRLRDRVTVPLSVTESRAKKLAQESQRVQAYLEGKELIKIIYVPKKLVNLVVV